MCSNNIKFNFCLLKFYSGCLRALLHAFSEGVWSRHYNCLLGASFCSHFSGQQLMQQASKSPGLARNGTNFETKCGCVRLIYWKPCGSDKRIWVRKYCRLTAKFNIHSTYAHRRWRQGLWPPIFTGQCLQVKIEVL